LGRIDKPHVIACAHELAAGNDTRPEHRPSCLDERSLLTVEPLRWALALRPRWVAMEQVPPVLELWTLFAGLLAAHGYETAVGVLRSEQYGVPQARRRAFLIASLDGAPRLPEPTHQSFDPRRHNVPERERHLPRWVSMAQALGWSDPAVVHTNNQTDSGRRPQGLTRSLDRPAHTLDTASGSWTIESTPPEPRPGARLPERLPEACERHAQQHRARVTEPPAEGVPGWSHRRPATTVCGDSRILAPGYWPRNDAPRGSVRPRPVRVTVEQAAILQGFRHDYPWHGSRTQRFTQIGNAVCPPLARHVLREAMRPSGRCPTRERRR
jgi:DNA (cytosine-5)-methyltransferase 1